MENKLTEIFQKAKLEPGLNMAGDILACKLILRDKRMQLDLSCGLLSTILCLLL
jgi:hypothetical protein